ncbi:MAG: hypothetical protein JNG85_11740 [Spirochaetaceae bacterium]|nr:hypothetical protein [Spirochaetaceae bacterium]
MRRVARPRSLVCALFILFAAAAPAQELAAWFDGAPEAAPYAAARERVLKAAAAAPDLPEGLLVERLVEGARKRVPPDRLAAALEAEIARLADLSPLFDRAKTDPEAFRELLAEGGLLLRAGASRAEIASALAVASPGEEGSRRALAAVSLLVALRARFDLGAAEGSRLAAALVRGAVPRDKFQNLLSVFARWKAQGLSVARVSAVVAEALEAGASLERVERELQRRTGKP